MKESQISDALRESMNAVRLSPALRARALCAMRGSEERRPKMKRKFSAALAFALVGVLVVAVVNDFSHHGMQTVLLARRDIGLHIIAGVFGKRRFRITEKIEHTLAVGHR